MSLALLPASGSGALADAAFATGDDDADGTWAAGDGRLQVGDDEGDVEVGEEGLQQALARVKAQARQVLASEAAGEAEGQEAPELQLLRASLVEVLGPQDGAHLASFIRSDTLPLGELDMGLEEEEAAGEGEEEATGGSAQLREVESELMRILEDLDTLDQAAAADGGAAGEVEDEDEDQGLEEQDEVAELDESWVLAEDEEEVRQRAEEYVAGVKRMDTELLRLYGRWVIGAAQLEDVVGDIQQLGEVLQLPDRVSVVERGGGCGGRGLDPSGRRGWRRGACVVFASRGSHGIAAWIGVHLGWIQCCVRAWCLRAQTACGW